MAWFTLLGLLRRFTFIGHPKRRKRSRPTVARHSGHQARLRVGALEEKLSPTPMPSPAAGAFEPAGFGTWRTLDLTESSSVARISVAPRAGISTENPAPQTAAATEGVSTRASVHLASWSADQQAGTADEAMSDPQNWSIFPASQHLLPLGGSSDASAPVAGSGGAAHFSSPAVFLPGDVAAVIGAFGSPVHSPTPGTGNSAQPGTNQIAAPPAATAGRPSLMQAKPASPLTAAPTATTSRASISGTLAPAVVTPSSSATTSSTTNTAEPLTSSNPFIVTGTFPPSLVPVLYGNTAANPAGELVQTSNQSQGGNPMATGGLSETGVRLADGTIQITGPDLSSAGFGNPWGQTRTWSNGAGYANTNIVGTGWVVDQLPYLQQNGAGNVIALISSSTNAYMFDNAGSGTFTPRYFLQNNLTDNTAAQEMDFQDDTGKKMAFFDFSSTLPTAEQGTLKSITDQFGNVTQVTAQPPPAKPPLAA